MVSFWWLLGRRGIVLLEGALPSIHAPLACPKKSAYHRTVKYRRPRKYQDECASDRTESSLSIVLIRDASRYIRILLV